MSFRREMTILSVSTCIVASHAFGEENKNVQLSSLRFRLDIIGYNRHILEIQRGVDFIHKVQRGRLEDVQRKDQGERRESLASQLIIFSSHLIFRRAGGERF